MFRVAIIQLIYQDYLTNAVTWNVIVCLIECDIANIHLYGHIHLTIVEVIVPFIIVGVGAL